MEGRRGGELCFPVRFGASDRWPRSDWDSRYTTKAFGPIMGKAATLTIVEAENIVPTGSIDPNDVDLPGIFVDRIVPATDEKLIEIKKLRESEQGDANGSTNDPAQIDRERIGRRAAKELRQGHYVNLGVGEFSFTVRCP